MGKIALLDKQTIDQIAAGEVIERPASVVKELIENAIDAQATEISLEIRDGGINYIRITDNGKGIMKEDVPLAFTRHATSKIRTIEDLFSVHSLGFRGEALSSIASVAKVELLTKTKEAMSGTRYVIHGGEEVVCTDAGIPNGTTIVVSSLFYNTPARRKYLGSANAEAGRIMELMQAVILSHPEIGFKFVSQGKVRLLTYGNAKEQGRMESIYRVLGRDIAKYLVPVTAENAFASVSGYIGRPEIGRGNRSYEYYFINGRYIKSKVIENAVEDGYRGFFMQHRYPVYVLDLKIPSEDLDVNVHPAKMELRLKNEAEVYELLAGCVRKTLQNKEWIPQVQLQPQPAEEKKPSEPVEETEKPRAEKAVFSYLPKDLSPRPQSLKDAAAPEPFEEKKIAERSRAQTAEPRTDAAQIRLPEKVLLQEDTLPDIRIIGQVFDTYWILQLEDKMYLLDQHAAHEKVLYETLLEKLRSGQHFTQRISPPVIISLQPMEERRLEKYLPDFEKLGFEIASFGGREIALSAVPLDLPDLGSAEAFRELLDTLDEVRGMRLEKLLARCATISCKAAVKGNMRLSGAEVQELIRRLMKLEDPYHCPHGRPTMISMTKQEIEKRFGRT